MRLKENQHAEYDDIPALQAIKDRILVLHYIYCTSPSNFKEKVSSTLKIAIHLKTTD